VTSQHAREHDLAQFLEQRRRQAQRAIRDQQQRGNRQERQLQVETVDQMLEDDRHADVRQLRHHQQDQRDDDALPVMPDVRHQPTHRGVQGGWRCFGRHWGH